jgi:hypothetical protein
MNSEKVKEHTGLNTNNLSGFKCDLWPDK